MADFKAIINTHATENGGIPATAIPTLVTAIQTAVGNEYVDKERYKAKLNEIDTLKEQQQTAEDNATTAGKWKDKYDALKKDFDDYKADIAGKEALAAKKAAFQKVAKDAGLTEAGIAKAAKYQDYSKIELDDKGEIKDAKDLMKSIKEEWPEHVAKKETKGAETPNPPEGGNGGSGYSDIRAMTAKWHAAKYGEVPKAKSAAESGNNE